MKRRDFVRTALAAGLAPGLLASPATPEPIRPRSGAARKKPRIMFFHDSRHPLMYMYEPPIQKQEVEAAVDELVETSVEVLNFCLADGRTVFHDTRVGEVFRPPRLQVAPRGFPAGPPECQVAAGRRAGPS